MADEVTTPRQVLVEHSDAAYDQAVATPTDSDAPEENWAAKLLLLLDVLVTEARLDRFDREQPSELADLSITNLLGALTEDDTDEFGL